MVFNTAHICCALHAMTTIAYAKGVLACDSRITSDSQYVGSAIKAIKTDKYLLAACGDLNCVQAFLRWGKKGFVDNKLRELLSQEITKNKGSFTGVSIDTTGTVYEFLDSVLPAPIKMYKNMYAIGSGSEYALGAMAAGCSAREAIKIAAKFDTNTGGKIREVYHG